MSWLTYILHYVVVFGNWSFTHGPSFLVWWYNHYVVIVYCILGDSCNFSLLFFLFCYSDLLLYAVLHCMVWNFSTVIYYDLLQFLGEFWCVIRFTMFFSCILVWWFIAPSVASFVGYIDGLLCDLWHRLLVFYMQ